MPITEIDAVAALILIDLQNGITGRELAHPADQVIENNIKLVAAFRAHKLPVIRVRVTPSADGGDALKPRADFKPNWGNMPADWAEFDPRIMDDPKDIRITKRQWGAFYGTELELQLRRRGVTNVVITGIATTYGVESTARDAYERGFNLTFPLDAMTDMSLEAHDNAVKYVLGRIGECGSTGDVLALLNKR